MYQKPEISKRAAAALLLAFLAAPAWAVNKCVDPAGAVSYQAAPCPGSQGTVFTVRPYPTSAGSTSAGGLRASERAALIQINADRAHQRAERSRNQRNEKARLEAERRHKENMCLYYQRISASDNGAISDQSARLQAGRRQYCR